MLRFYRVILRGPFLAVKGQLRLNDFVVLDLLMFHLPHLLDMLLLHSYPLEYLHLILINLLRLFYRHSIRSWHLCFAV